MATANNIDTRLRENGVLKCTEDKYFTLTIPGTGSAVRAIQFGTGTDVVMKKGDVIHEVEVRGKNGDLVTADGSAVLDQAYIVQTNGSNAPQRPLARLFPVGNGIQPQETTYSASSDELHMAAEGPATSLTVDGARASEDLDETKLGLAFADGSSFSATTTMDSGTASAVTEGIRVRLRVRSVYENI